MDTLHQLIDIVFRDAPNVVIVQLRRYVNWEDYKDNPDKECYHFKPYISESGPFKAFRLRKHLIEGDGHTLDKEANNNSFVKSIQRRNTSDAFVPEVQIPTLGTKPTVEKMLKGPLGLFQNSEEKIPPATDAKPTVKEILRGLFGPF